MKKQTKYTNRLELEAAILRLKREAANEYRLAESHQQKMKVLFDKANDPALEAGTQSFNRTKGFQEKRLATRNLTRARRIEDIKLPKLKNALAAFNTETFEFSKGDKSVVIN